MFFPQASFTKREEEGTQERGAETPSHLRFEVWNQNSVLFRNTYIGSVNVDLGLIESIDGHPNWYELDTEGSLQCVISRYYTEDKQLRSNTKMWQDQDDEKNDGFGVRRDRYKQSDLA